MPRSPRRFLSWPMRALTKLWRSLAYLYSAFSERSPWARATAISLGSSTLSSCSRVSISCCNFDLIFARGSVIRSPLVQKNDAEFGLTELRQNDIIKGREMEEQGEEQSCRHLFSK